MKNAAPILVALICFIAATPLLARDDAADLFSTRCANCHGRMGRPRIPADGRPMLRDLSSTEVQRQTDAELTQIVAAGGRTGDPSHSFKRKGLTDEHIRRLVGFIRSLAKREE